MAAGHEELEVNDLQQEHESSDDSVTYTVEEALQQIGHGCFQILISVLSGFILLAEAVELILLSVLSPAVKCQWFLSYFEEALITTVVFFGFFIGGLFWGICSGIVGRKVSLFIAILVVLGFAVLSAIPVSSDDKKIPGYLWLLVCRFC